MAYDFTGGATNRYLSVASAPASGSPMTIAGWFYATSTAGQAVICSVGQNGSPAHRNQLFMQGGGPLQIIAIGSLGTGQVSAGNITANQWEHCAGVVASSTSYTPYLNGVAGTTGTTNIGTQNAANETLINARNNGSIGIISNASRIAEVGIWNVALTAAEIASLADGMTCDKVRPDSLVFYAPLVRNLIDYSGGLTITNNNSATVAVHPRVYA